MDADIIVLGVFVADTTFRAKRAPKMGETILGDAFHLGPGGKGSNQAVAAAKAGAKTAIITRLGQDAFAQMALDLWQESGVIPAITQSENTATGAANIFIEAASGNNAIIIYPGAAGDLTASDLEKNEGLIKKAKVFITQLEQPLAAAHAGLKLAKKHQLLTILNPAPATALPDEILRLCDYITPNESEAEALTGIAVDDVEGARKAAQALCAKGVGTVIITLGERGALLHNGEISELIPATFAGNIAETTGAGDAFNGSFATGLARGMAPLDAMRFASAAAGISVTRAGAAAAMPDYAEIIALMEGGS